MPIAESAEHNGLFASHLGRYGWLHHIHVYPHAVSAVLGRILSVFKTEIESKSGGAIEALGKHRKHATQWPRACGLAA